MDHLPWLLDRGVDTGGEACGHALMATCPPEPFSKLDRETPFGSANLKSNQQPSNRATTPSSASDQSQLKQEPAQKTWELNKGDLSTLLALSERLDLDGEITPVMAWGMILRHSRVAELSAHDSAQLAEVLKGKVRCYGFGAVMEEFEVRDAIENIFSTKQELAVQFKTEPMVAGY